ncbi:WAS/WASL-interacting protein family member 3-like isoform X4 [Panicum virgatum]|uniref:WAS/WASL-interacting protein family member 3-like isoform X4 n=1 Tax=Panicum virgatum TaxID=38727 RepID=UPI0019D6839C|nr:WAS/WASL-interacting protein family member 3-like isoform X4 [Panicum virgatum]
MRACGALLPGDSLRRPRPCVPGKLQRLLPPAPRFPAPPPSVPPPPAPPASVPPGRSLQRLLPPAPAIPCAAGVRAAPASCKACSGRRLSGSGSVRRSSRRRRSSSDLPSNQSLRRPRGAASPSVRAAEGGKARQGKEASLWLGGRAPEASRCTQGEDVIGCFPSQPTFQMLILQPGHLHERSQSSWNQTAGRPSNI